MQVPTYTGVSDLGKVAKLGVAERCRTQIRRMISNSGCIL